VGGRRAADGAVEVDEEVAVAAPVGAVPGQAQGLIAPGGVQGV